MTYLLVNFGGPRDLEEVSPFLVALLSDPDVIRTKLPRFAQNWLFGRIARKRALKVRKDYEEIGGRSPIYFDTEELAKALSSKLGAPVLTFHRYLAATHDEALQRIEAIQDPEIRVIPLFPQFSYATTGSIARLFEKRLKPQTVRKLRWIKSYAGHPAFIHAYTRRIRDFLVQKQLPEEETTLLYSAHGVPLSFIATGDLYESECQLSFRQMRKEFVRSPAQLAYQSKFGPEEWLRPYTDELCQQIEAKQVVIVPLSFTSDHIETLFEIEKLYVTAIAARGIPTYRCPALNLEPYWVDALAEIAQEHNLVSNPMLIRGS